MPCEECDRLSNRLKAALAEYQSAVGGTSSLHGFDLQFHGANERSEKARERLNTCRAALQEHEQHHQDLAKKESA